MNHVALVGLGFLAGTAGMKVIASKPVRKACVKGLVQGMKAKDQCETLIEEAKAEFDDLMAEAEYEKDAQSEDVVVVEEAKAPAKKITRARAKKTKAAEAE
ncbi:MAG: DUF1490 family protein [Eggerthellaceae bacterium]|nr:DUF1490 family protein [Eggerthellaceae bacterium]